MTRSGARRTVAWLVAVLLVAVGLGTPATATAATTDEPVATVVHVEQTGPWWAGGALDLDVAVTTPAGAPAAKGALWVAVDGVTRSPGIPAPAGPMHVSGVTLPGSHEVTVRFVPGDGFAASQWVGVLEVEAGSTPSTTAVEGPNRAPYGTAAEIDVAVTADGVQPAGQVALWWGDGATPMTSEILVDGTAHFRLPVVDPRSEPYPYRVVYYGLDGVETSQVSRSLVVERATKKLSIWSNDVQDDVTYTSSAPWEVAVYVPDLYRIDGTVSLYDGSRLLRREHVDSTYWAAHTFELGTKDLGVGKHTLVATISGSPYVHDMRATMKAFTVKKHASAVHIERGASPWRWGAPHRLRVYVSDAWRYADEVPQGTVTIYHGRKKVGSTRVDRDGSMTMTIGAKALPTGKVRLRAVYSGSGIYDGKTTYRTVSVGKAATRTSVRMVDRSLHGSQRGRLRIHVTTRKGVALMGWLQIKVDDKKVMSVHLRPKDHGRRTVLLPSSIEPEPHYLKVVYVGTRTTARSVSRNGLYFTVS